MLLSALASVCHTCMQVISLNCKTLIRSVVIYGVETWMMTKKEEQAVLIFERKIFKRMYGPEYEDGEWKSRMN